MKQKLITFVLLWGTALAPCALYAADGDELPGWPFRPSQMSLCTPVSDLQISGPCAIGFDGTVYYGNKEQFTANMKHIFAVATDGVTQGFCPFPLGDATMTAEASPSIGDDGTIYFATEGLNEQAGYVCAIGPNGSLKWISSPGENFRTTPAIGRDGTLYITSMSPSKLYAIKPTDGLATQITSVPSSDNTMAPVSIGADGTIYLGTTAQPFRAIDPVTRQVKWSVALDGFGTDVPPAIGDDGKLYVATGNGRIYRITPPQGPGQLPDVLGSAQLDAFGNPSPPVLDPDGIVYVRFADTGKLFAVRADTLEPVWPAPLETGHGSKAAPAIAMDGTIYTTVFNQFDGIGRVIALNRDGTIKWESPVDLHFGPSQDNFNSIMIGANGTIFVPATIRENNVLVGEIHALAASSPPARSGWPMFMRDARHTGRAVHGQNIAAAHLFSLARRPSDGQLFGCGRNDHAELGLGFVSPSVKPVTLIPGLVKVKRFAGGGTFGHGLAVTTDKKMYGWGSNSGGQVGNGGVNDPVRSPSLIGPSDARWITVAAGHHFSVALRDNGTVYSWGVGLSTGHADGQNRNVPSQIPTLSRIVDVQAGDSWAMALDAEDYIWVWGFNPKGIGNGTTRSQTPVKLTSLPDVVAIEMGQWHAVALQITQPGPSFAVQRKVWVWGGNGKGQLGIGAPEETVHATPIHSTGFVDVTDIAAGGDTTFAISGRTVRGCGHNALGNLGNNDTADVSTPVIIPQWDGVARLDAGLRHTLGLQPAGNIQSCGNNFFWPLGDPATPGTRAVPGVFGPLP